MQYTKQYLITFDNERFFNDAIEKLNFYEHFSCADMMKNKAHISESGEVHTVYTVRSKYPNIKNNIPINLTVLCNATRVQDADTGEYIKNRFGGE